MGTKRSRASIPSSRCGDALHRGVAAGQILLREAALIIAAHPRPQKDMGRIEPAGRRPFIVQGEIGIDDKLETVVEGVGLFHPVGQPALFGDLFLFLVFQIGDELFFSLDAAGGRCAP